jgi:CheY-like chemotaxis protein
MQSEPVVILVVDDDQAIQDVVMDALSEGGFEAAITQSGEEAVTLLQGASANYRALTDINLLGLPSVRDRLILTSRSST